MSEQRPVDGQPHTASGGASWANWYHDLTSLKAASDAVVAGTIAEVRSVTANRRSPHWHLLIEHIDFTFAVRQQIWDPRSILAVPWIIVRQTGGVWDDLRYELAEDPLFQVGEEAVLFLREWGARRFSVAGGPTGRFTIRGGLITPAAGRVPVAPNTTLGDFSASVRAA